MMDRFVLEAEPSAMKRVCTKHQAWRDGNPSHSAGVSHEMPPNHLVTTVETLQMSLQPCLRLIFQNTWQQLPWMARFGDTVLS